MYFVFAFFLRITAHAVDPSTTISEVSMVIWCFRHGDLHQTYFMYRIRHSGGSVSLPTARLEYVGKVLEVYELEKGIVCVGP